MSTPETPTTGATEAEGGDPTAVSADARPSDLQDERLIASSQGIGGWASATWGRLRSGDLGSAPVVIGLVLIWGVFYALEPAFLSSRNLVNLTLQMCAVGTIAIGVVMVLLLGEIDLSIGAMAGVTAAILAVLFVSKDTGVLVAVLVALAAGAVVGLVYGFLYNRFGVPSFVITLAGLLGFLCRSPPAWSRSRRRSSCPSGSQWRSLCWPRSSTRSPRCGATRAAPRPGCRPRR